jgi:hypothetical protein
MSALPLAPIRVPELVLPTDIETPRERAFAMGDVLPVAGLTLLLGGAAVAWGFTSNTILAYSDAQTHLAIARRILDSRTPGAAQFGTSWLPVPHLLLMLFVYIGPLWQTGLAGSLVGLGCLTVTTVSVFCSTLLLTGRRSMSWLAVAVLLTNPNFMYVHTTALTEPVLIASMSASTYYLVKWSKTRRWPDMIAAGALAALAVGSRYEGWAFAAASAAVVVWVSYFASGDRLQAEGLALGYVAPPVYAMGMWIFYNWLIFGDPLSFARGQYSAAASTAATTGATVKGHLALSFMTYGWDCMDVIGLPILLSAALGLLAHAWRTRLSASGMAVYVVAALFCFDTLLLFVGQIPMITPRSTPPGFFNLRYVLLLLPGIAILAACLGDALEQVIRPGYVLFIGGLMLASQALWLVPDWPHSVTVLEEGYVDVRTSPERGQVAAYLREHYEGGGILIDERASDWATLAGIPEREYIATYSGPLFRQALSRPADYVQWVVADLTPSPDQVATVLLPSPLFQERYQLVATYGGFNVFERRR